MYFLFEFIKYTLQYCTLIIRKLLKIKFNTF